MKKHIFKIFGLAALILVSCSEELIVDEVIDSTTSGGVLRNLGVTNGLDIETGTSTWSIVLEAQDGSNGKLLKEVKVSVGFNDVDSAGTKTTAESEYTRIPASAFNEKTDKNTHKLPVTTFTVTLDELRNHLGANAVVSAKDEFTISFAMELTDGRIFNADNATGDITRSGFFSYFNAQFAYDAEIGDPQRLVLSSSVIKDANKTGGRLKNGDVDTLFFTFNKDSLVVVPTVTRISSGGVTDDVVGALTQNAKKKTEWFLLYTAGSVDDDTISFRISGGAAVANLPMVNDTLKNTYFIDTTPPAGKLSGSSVTTDPGGRFLKVAFNLAYETLKEKDTLQITIANNGGAAFDAQSLEVVTAEGGQDIIPLSFVPQVSGTALTQGRLDLRVTVTDVEDLVGNKTTDVVDIVLGGT